MEFFDKMNVIIEAIGFIIFTGMASLALGLSVLGFVAFCVSVVCWVKDLWENKHGH